MGFYPLSNGGERMVVYGVVTELSQQPVEGARVSIQVGDASGKTIHLALVYTDRDGYYSDQFKMPENVNGSSRFTFQPSRRGLKAP